MNNPKLVLLDCCLPDYFRGHHNRVLVCYPTNETTVMECLEELESDANSQEITKEFCGFDYADLEKAFIRFQTDNKTVLAKACFPSLESIPESESDDFESVAAYFTIIDED